MTAIRLQPRLAHTINFSPRLQQAVRLLQMSTLDYAEALQDAALANPFLEVDAPAQVSEMPGGDNESEVAQAADRAEIEWAQGLDRLAGNEPAASQRLSHDDSFDLLQQAPVRMSLRAHLHAQLGVLRLDPRERFLADALVEALDDDGYLRLSLEELAEGLGTGTGSDLHGHELRTARRRSIPRVSPPAASRNAWRCSCAGSATTRCASSRSASSPSISRCSRYASCNAWRSNWGPARPRRSAPSTAS